MSCPACGQAPPRGANFCFACGASLARVCPECQAGQPPDAKFCPECGATVPPRDGGWAQSPPPGDTSDRRADDEPELPPETPVALLDDTELEAVLERTRLRESRGRAPALPPRPGGRVRGQSLPSDEFPDRRADDEPELPPELAASLLDDEALEAALERTRLRESRRRVAAVAAALLVVLAIVGGAAFWMRGGGVAPERSARSGPADGSAVSPGVSTPAAPEAPATAAAEPPRPSAVPPQEEPATPPPTGSASPSPAVGTATPGPASEASATPAPAPVPAPAPDPPRSNPRAATTAPVPDPAPANRAPSPPGAATAEPARPRSLPERVTVVPPPTASRSAKAAPSPGPRAGSAEPETVAAMPERARADVRVDITSERLGGGLTAYTVRLNERDGKPVTDAVVAIRGRRADGALVEAELDSTSEPGVYRAAVRSGEVRNPRLRVTSAGRIQDMPVTD